VSSPWGEGALAGVRPGAHVVAIGTGLTMVDVALTLARDRRARITAVSRHGLLPQTHGEAAATAPCIMSARTTTELVRAVRVAASKEEDWRSVVDALRPVTADLWRSLPPSEQRRFLRHVRPYWETHRHRIPPATAETLRAMIEAGRLVVRCGHVRSIHRSGVTIDCCGNRRIYLPADTVFDCTGPALDVARSSSRLVRSLLLSGLAAADPSGLGLHAEPTGELVGAAGIFAVGPLVRGGAYEGTAVPELRVHAERAAAVIAERLRRGARADAPGSAALAMA
jgi:uncharacterized NAD(P)/FAD-binding protein YdhS